MESLPEPPANAVDLGELLAGYLDYYRAVVTRKLNGMSGAELGRTRVPSGWTPLGLLKHLTYVERRWFRWGFMAEAVDHPWGPSGRGSDWMVQPGETEETLLVAFQEECNRSRAIVAGADLSDRARSGGRFNPPDEHPTLIWILFHVLQEYARHAGHLDIVRELANGSAGE